MQTTLAPEFAGTPDGTEAEAILRRCVHCGFCTATCPTYHCSVMSWTAHVAAST